MERTVIDRLRENDLWRKTGLLAKVHEIMIRGIEYGFFTIGDPVADADVI